MPDIVYDMETQDPDDFLTLLLLLGHPQVKLRAVTITPGSRYQVGLVRRALSWFGEDIPVGAFRLDHPKTCVSPWHERAYGKIAPSDDALPGGEVLKEQCNEKMTLLTGAALHNLGAAMELGGLKIGRWVAQGGFAGEGVVPTEKQLSKFRGKTTMATYNLNGEPAAAVRALTYDGIDQRYFVSKNVCHGVVYDNEFHEYLAGVKDRSLSLSRIWQGMDIYLSPKRRESRPRRAGRDIEADPIRLISDCGVALGIVSLPEATAIALDRRQTLVEVATDAEPVVCRLVPEGKMVEEICGTRREKKLHDPLAACCAIDPEIGVWAEVDLYREKNRWGSQLRPGSNTWIIIDYDRQRFLEVFTSHD